MKEINKKIFASSVAASIIATFISWLIFAPAAPEPTVIYAEIDDKTYYIVNIDGEEWVTRAEKPINYSSNWVNMKTGETPVMDTGRIPFWVDTCELLCIVEEWNREKYNKGVQRDIEKIKGM